MGDESTSSWPSASLLSCKVPFTSDAFDTFDKGARPGWSSGNDLLGTRALVFENRRCGLFQATRFQLRQLFHVRMSSETEPPSSRLFHCLGSWECILGMSPKLRRTRCDRTAPQRSIRVAFRVFRARNAPNCNGQGAAQEPGILPRHGQGPEGVSLDGPLGSDGSGRTCRAFGRGAVQRSQWKRKRRRQFHVQMGEGGLDRHVFVNISVQCTNEQQ